MSMRRFGSFVGVAALAVSASCAMFRARDARPGDRGEGDLHWVRGRELQEIMARMDVPDAPGEPVAKDFDSAMIETFELADALAKAAERIPEAMAHMRLSEADRSAFVAQAETLRDQALRLKDAAAEHDTEGMEKALFSIEDTCISCHDRFRDVSGAIELRQAAAQRERPDRFDRG